MNILCLIKYVTKTYGGVEAQQLHELTSARGGGEWSVSSPGRFTPRKRVSGTHLIASCVGPSGEDKNAAETHTPVVQPVAQVLY